MPNILDKYFSYILHCADGRVLKSTHRYPDADAIFARANEQMHRNSISGGELEIRMYVYGHENQSHKTTETKGFGPFKKTVEKTVWVDVVDWHEAETWLFPVERENVQLTLDSLT